MLNEHEKRDEPYIYVTWLPKFLIGENHCYWKAWFKSHYKYDKLPSDFDLTIWTMSHNSLLIRCKELLEIDGWKVKIEDQNSFKIEMTTNKNEKYILAGKPDIIAMKKLKNDKELILIEDIKTGKQRGSDSIQVMLYMMIIADLFAINFEENIVEGVVIYNNNTINIPFSKITDNFKKEVIQLLEKISGGVAPSKCPSKKECQWCDISKNYCNERIK